MILSRDVIRGLLAGSSKQLLALHDVYGQLPATGCRRRTLCCSLLPEMSLLEALAAMKLMVNTVPAEQQRFYKALIRYFFLNPVEISLCPFLDNQDCLIYQDRFFGCRAYGLWSRQYYEKQAARSRQAKQLSQKQWQGLGVSLPQEVINYKLPYCPYVKLEGNLSVDDEMVQKALDAIEGFSGQLSPWHEAFRQIYYADMSFLVASLVFGTQDAVRLKFEIVRDVMTTGNMEKVKGVLGNLPDQWVSLT